MRVCDQLKRLLGVCDNDDEYDDVTQHTGVIRVYVCVGVVKIAFCESLFLLLCWFVCFCNFPSLTCLEEDDNG